MERELGPPYDFPDHLKILGDGEVNRPLPWELYDLAADRAEANDLADGQPARVAEMAASWQREMEAMRSSAKPKG